MFRKYESVVRYGKKRTEEIVAPGEYITIWEKLDGANASFKLVDGEIKAYSRNQELDGSNTLRGFYDWAVNTLDKSKLREGITYYGEWLVPHKVVYNEDAYRKFYLFDVLKINGYYASSDSVRLMARSLGCELAPILYEGEFRSIDHIVSFVGNSKFGEEGEGVVVKNIIKKNMESAPYLKFVSKKFSEMQMIPTKSKSVGIDGTVEGMLNVPRVEKLINKLIDEGKVPSELDFTDMGTLLKALGSSVYDDIIEEELDTILAKIKHKIGREMPLVVKQVISDRYQTEEEK